MRLKCVIEEEHLKVSEREIGQCDKKHELLNKGDSCGNICGKQIFILINSRLYQCKKVKNL